MKPSIAVFTLLLAIFFNSCSQSDNQTDSGENTTVAHPIFGTWTLIKENKNGKLVNYKGKPTALKLTLKDNGYFILFDKITDEKIKNSGVGAIQEYYKGQFEKKNKTLVMNRFEGDSLISEKYHIKELSGDELVLNDTKGNHTQYFKKQG